MPQTNQQAEQQPTMFAVHKKPEELHPALTEERLRAVARLLLKGRHLCLAEHKPPYDSRWSYGCRARDWCREVMRQAAGAVDYEWLAILEDSGQKFLVAIEGVPFKFFVDDPEDPVKDGVSTLSIVEAAQGSLFEFYGMSEHEKVMFRFLLESAGHDLEVTRIVFVARNQFEETVCYYNIPLEPPVATLYEIGAVCEEGVELAPPTVGPKKGKDKDANSDSSGNV